MVSAKIEGIVNRNSADAFAHCVGRGLEQAGVKHVYSDLEYSRYEQIKSYRKEG